MLERTVQPISDLAKVDYIDILTTVNEMGIAGDFKTYIESEFFYVAGYGLFVLRGRELHTDALRL